MCMCRRWKTRCIAAYTQNEDDYCVPQCQHQVIPVVDKYLRFCLRVLHAAPASEPDGFPSICPPLWVLRVLQSEYRRLKWKHEEAAAVPMLTEAGEGGPGSPAEGGQQDEELLAEARVLRQHKTRLETRMGILEDHNKQLESQLCRLRELLLQVEVGEGVGCHRESYTYKCGI